MKKFLGKKDKGDKEDKESKKEKKEKEKKEKKEKKKEAKEAKLAAKGNSGNSSTNLEKTQESVTVVKTTTLSSSPGTETRKVVTETTQHDNGKQSTVTTTVQETKSKSNEPSVVQKTTTTIVKSSSEDPENDIKTETVTQTSESVEENESAAPLEDEEEKTVTVVKKEVTISPDSEEKVVITKTTSQVESIPSTRELLENSFPQAAIFDKTSILRESTNDDDGLTSQHFSKTTIVRSQNGDSIETTTQVVTDESGTKTTTTTSSGSDDGPIVSVHSDSKADLPDWLETRDEKRPVNGKAAIDDSIEIPSPEVGRKEMKKTEHSGPPVKEQITPEAEKKEDIANFLDLLSDSGKEKSKDEEKQPIKDDTNVVELMDALESAPPSQNDTLTDSNKEKTKDVEQQAAKDDGMDELLDALQTSNKPQNDTSKGKPKDEEKQPSKADNNLSDLMDALESDSKSTEPKPAKVNQPSPMKQTPSRTNEKPQAPSGISSTVPSSPRRLSPQVSSPRRLAKPKTKEKVLLERHAKKLMKNGEVYETITEIFKDKDGKIETTTTTKKLEYQPQEVIDLNVNLLQSKPIQGTEKKKQYEDDDPFVHEGDEINPEEVFEEILVVQKKPKVRFPKSFLPRTPERPKSWGLPLDLLVERQRSPRRSVGYMYGREVNENVKPVSKNKMTELQELDRMLEVIGASD